MHRLWRYLNLMHVIAYCGLTSSYNKDNCASSTPLISPHRPCHPFALPLCSPPAVFDPLVDKYNLLGHGSDKQEEEELLTQVDLDEQGLRAFGMYEAWTLDVIKSQVSAARLSAPLHVAMDQQTIDIAAAVKKLYAFSCEEFAHRLNPRNPSPPHTDGL